MIKTKRVSFQRVLLSTSKSRDLDSAANEWKFRDYSESSYEPIPCSFCGQPIKRCVFIENTITGEILPCGRICYRNLLALKAGLSLEDLPSYQGRRKVQIIGKLRAVYSGIPVNFKSWRNWFLAEFPSLSDAPPELREGLLELKWFGVLSEEHVDRFIRYHDEHRLFPKEILLPGSWRFKDWLPKRITISIMREVRKAQEDREEAFEYIIDWLLDNGYLDNARKFLIYACKRWGKAEYYYKLGDILVNYYYGESSPTPAEKEGVKYLEKAIKIDPAHEKARFLLSLAKESIGLRTRNYGEAIRELRGALRVLIYQFKDEEIRKEVPQIIGDIFYDLARIYAKMGKVRKAARLLRRHACMGGGMFSPPGYWQEDEAFQNCRKLKVFLKIVGKSPRPSSNRGFYTSILGKNGSLKEMT